MLIAALILGALLVRVFPEPPRQTNGELRSHAQGHVIAANRIQTDGEPIAAAGGTLEILRMTAQLTEGLVRFLSDLRRSVKAASDAALFWVVVSAGVIALFVGTRSPSRGTRSVG